MSFLSKSSDKIGKRGQTVGALHTLPLQAKLRMGRPGDAYEQEADRTADRVVDSPPGKTAVGPVTPVSMQRQSQGEEALQNKAEEEEPVQTKVEEEDEQRQEVQKQKQEDESEEEERLVQTKREDEEEPLQGKPLKDLNPPDKETEQMLKASKSGGTPMEPVILREMEQKFNRRFQHVRIHADGVAVELCRRLNAKAFTHGDHIYFGGAYYQPAETEGKRLLAHELTHVVQQTGDVRPKLIQRTNGGGVNSGSAHAPPMISNHSYRGAEGHIDNRGKTMIIPLLKIPDFKRTGDTPTQNLLIRKGRPENVGRSTNQRREWDNASRQGAGLESALRRKISRSPLFIDGGQQIYYLQIGKRATKRTNYLVGSYDQIKERVLRPYWTRNGVSQLFEVDHIREYQLNGPDNINNLWLLEKKANASSGSRINNQIERKVKRLLDASAGTPMWQNKNKPDYPNARREYEITFDRVEFNLPVRSKRKPPLSYTLNQIRDGALHIPPLKVIDNVRDVERAGLRGSDTEFVVFNNATGGRRRTIKVTSNQRQNVPFTDNSFIPGFRPTTALITPEEVTIIRIRGKLYSTNPALFGHGIRFEVPIKKMGTIPHTGHVNVSSLITGIKRVFSAGNVSVSSMSPIRLKSVDFDAQNNLEIVGKVETTIPIIRNADIRVALIGNDLTLEKTFSAGDFSFPSPIQVKSSNLTVAIGTRRGISINGETAVEISRLGQGRIGAAASTSGGFELEGEFNFDSRLFDPARVGITYRNNIFGLTGKLGIPPGKLRGIKRAAIDVSYTRDTLTARGGAELDMPGVENGSMQVEYGPQGFSLGGDFKLKGDIPGIRSGSVKAVVRKVTGEEGYRVMAQGKAVPDIPGITSELTVEYDNGAIKIQGHAAYNRGLLSGKINVGATNRAIVNNQPTGPPTDNIVVYGGGSLMLRITPWLQGSAGVRFQPNGEIVIMGRIGIPSTVEVFRRIGIPERTIFDMGFDIPIFAIPVGPRSIGLVASIKGGLKTHAGIGPGRLEKLELGITYNPSRPDDARVNGKGRFIVPAKAGLTLSVRATIGLSAGIGGVEGGIELGSGIGLDAAAEAGVSVDWTPRTGLELNAHLAAYVQPKFVFTIDGLIRAWILWYEKIWRWRLSNFEYGSNMRFGVRLPIHYKEGEPFDISYKKLKIERPEINAPKFIGGLIRDIRSRRS